MAGRNPSLLAIAMLVREDGKALFVQHAGGPFAGRWSPPLIGVAERESAEDALDRLVRQYLHLTPGAAEFLDTLYVEAGAGERFIANAFTCTGWQGTARFPAEIFQDAIWTAAAEAQALELLPEVAAWLSSMAIGADGAPEVMRDFDAEELLTRLADARGDLIAAFEAIPRVARPTVRDEDGWSALDVLAHVAEVEAYYLAELRRCVEAKGRTWRAFNAEQWLDMHRLRPAEDEASIRERVERVRSETRSWLKWQPPAALEEYLNHPEHVVVQAGNRIEKIAAHDREHTGQLRQIAQAAAVLLAEETDGQP